VFVKPAGGWSGHLTETAKLTASDGAIGDAFGGGVAIDGDTIVIGSPGADVGGNNNQGSAYVFVKPPGGWAGHLTETAKLTASDEGGAAYSRSLAISGDTIAIGAAGHDETGAAYIFVEPPGGWAENLTETAKLTASDGAAFRRFRCLGGVSGTRSSRELGTVTVPAQIRRSIRISMEPGGGWSGHTHPRARI
jgi:hypothetical protein